MRRILVERAHARRTLKQGSVGPAVTFDDGLLIAPAAGPDRVALDDAFKDLGRGRHFGE